MNTTRSAGFHDEILRSLLDIDRLALQRSIDGMLKTLSPLEILDRYFIPAFQKIGSGWIEGASSISQVYMAGKICDEIIPSLLQDRGATAKNRVPLAIALLRDQHVLGKKIVLYALRSAGYRLIDYGSIAEPEILAKKALGDDARVLLISTLMLPSALLIKDAVRLVRQKKPEMQIIVGGAPFNFDSNLWKEVGADAMGLSATEAVSLVDRFLNTEGGKTA